MLLMLWEWSEKALMSTFHDVFYIVKRMVMDSLDTVVSFRIHFRTCSVMSVTKWQNNLLINFWTFIYLKQGYLDENAMFVHDFDMRVLFFLVCLLALFFVTARISLLKCSCFVTIQCVKLLVSLTYTLMTSIFFSICLSVCQMLTVSLFAFRSCD